MNIYKLLEGATFPVKICQPEVNRDYWYDIIGPARKKDFPGYDLTGYAVSIPRMMNDEGWEFYIEPDEQAMLDRIAKIDASIRVMQRERAQDLALLEAVRGKNK